MARIGGGGDSGSPGGGGIGGGGGSGGPGGGGGLGGFLQSPRSDWRWPRGTLPVVTLNPAYLRSSPSPCAKEHAPPRLHELPAFHSVHRFVFVRRLRGVGQVLRAVCEFGGEGWGNINFSYETYEERGRETRSTKRSGAGATAAETAPERNAV